MIGQVVGNYRIQAKLGEGGMGVVYVAEHMALGRRAALKMILAEYSAKHEMVTRFFTEARSAASIEHPGMVDVYDFGQHTDGSAYIVMEFLQGETLTKLLARAGGRLDPDLTMALGRQIAGAIGAAHQKGIIHRDLKPDNIYLVPDPEIAVGMRAKVLDFGIAKLTGDSRPGTNRTRTGVLMGTPIYMSPEQCHGAGHVDARADIYSLGCILYQLVSGHPPFESEGVGEVIAKHLYEVAPPLTKVVPGTPAALSQVVMRCLAKTPADRPQTMEDLAVGLGGVYASRPPVGPNSEPMISVRTHHPTVKRPLRRRLLLAGAAIAVLGGVGAALTLGRGDDGRARAVAQAAAPPAEKPAPAPPPPAPAPVKLAVRSEPPGAEVYRAADGIKLGKTPLVHEVPSTRGLAVFILKLPGYDEARAELPADTDGEAVVTLTKIEVAPPPAPPPPPPAAAAKPARPTARKPPPEAGGKKGINDGTLDPFAQ